MELPSLPTDSLYKFLAISGLVLAIWAPSFAYINVESRSESLNNLLEDTVRFETESRFLENEKDTVNGNQSDPKIILEESKKMIETGVLLQERLKQLDRSLSSFTPVIYFLFVMASIGSIMSITGFWLWYLKIQKPMDILLMKKVIELNKIQ